MKVGIIGGAGYTGGELLRILIHHPAVEIVFVNSKSQAGKPVYSTHTDLLGDTDLLFQTTFIQILMLLSFVRDMANRRNSWKQILLSKVLKSLI